MRAPPANDWFDELNLSPDAHPVAMGTRTLGERPWLVADQHRDTELALKDELLATRRDDVLVASGACVDAAVELGEMIAAATVDTAASRPPCPDVHPLETAARSVQEDLCLLDRHDDGWYLDSGCVCFPTRWNVSEKTGQHIAAVHGPVQGYASRIADRVDRLFDQLTDRPVWRRNWFLMSDPTLFQPDRPPTEPVVAADRVGTDVFIRSERQTLRRLPRSGWIVFTIRIQQEPLATMLTTRERAERFLAWVEHVSPDYGDRRHLTDRQRAALSAALERQLQQR